MTAVESLSVNISTVGAVKVAKFPSGRHSQRRRRLQGTHRRMTARNSAIGIAQHDLTSGVSPNYYFSIFRKLKRRYFLPNCSCKRQLLKKSTVSHIFRSSGVQEFRSSGVQKFRM
jgi:hypothetical protein